MALKKTFSLNQVLEELDLLDNDDRSVKIYVSPPDEMSGQKTDEDSGDEDGDRLNMNNLGRENA